MSYAYEQLSDDHFQWVVQSLLTDEFRGVQCLPVNMPDGGRDALQRDYQSRPVHIFQVKMARKPHEIKDVVEWIANVIAKEMPKIERLIERGCSRYQLITNIDGSSHLDAGGVDRVQSLLDTLKVRADCWWRNDLDRRLDKNFDLRLRFPALIDGVDLARLLLEHGSNAENKMRRKEALEAYFSDQYGKDRYIRFKQIELDNAELFDLFIDVPIIPLRPAGRAGAELHREYSMAVERSARQQAWHDRESGRASAIAGVATNPRSGLDEDTDEGELIDAPFYRHDAAIGAAELLVEPRFRPPGAGIIIEGAPGQGKSTLSQFLVQIQRARLLGDRSVMSKLSPHHLSSPAQIPFKLEFRDLAVWMRGLDPWDNDQERAHGRTKSLEGALAAHVERFSGGIEFSVIDLRYVIRGKPTLLVLDALDEVADLQDRAMVIEEVTSAIGRLVSVDQNPSAEQNLRVLITSRRNAISTAPTFSSSKFCYLRLDSISRQEALRYNESLG